MTLRDMIREALDTASGTPAREVYEYLLQVESRLGPNNDGLLYAYLQEASTALVSLVARIQQMRCLSSETDH